MADRTESVGSRMGRSRPPACGPTSYCPRTHGAPCLGFHPSINRGFLCAIERSISYGATCAQMWMGNSKGYASRMIPEAEYEPVAKLVKENNFFLIAHSPYILNFARPLQESPVGLSALNRYIRDLQNVTNLGGVGSVLHIGSAVDQDSDQALDTFVDNLRWVIERMPEKATIILENMAGGGKQLCTTMEQWGELWNEKLDPSDHSRIKWCIDTAHLFAAGEYNVSSPRMVDRFRRDFDETIGWDDLLCFHFNGSKSGFGSHKDCHDDIGSGKIANAGLCRVAQIAAETNKPMILEVPVESFTLLEQFETVTKWSTAQR